MKEGVQTPQSSLPTSVLFVLVATAVAFLGINMFMVFKQSRQDQEALHLIADMRVSSYRLPTLTRDAANGESQAFIELENIFNRMEESWSSLGTASELADVGNELNAVDVIFQQTKNNAETLQRNRDSVLFLKEVSTAFNHNFNQLQQENAKVAKNLLSRNTPRAQIAIAHAQTWRTERIGRNIDRMFAGLVEGQDSAAQFNQDAQDFGRVLNGMLKGDAGLGVNRVNNLQAREGLERITGLFGVVDGSVEKIVDATTAARTARQAAGALLANAPLLQAEINQLTLAIEALPEQRLLSEKKAMIAAAVVVVLLIMIALLKSAATRRRLQISAEANAANQQSILRLLDEIGDLADGDLTAHATVTEDFTGAIADSINYAIDQLRILVARIQETSEGVSSAAYETSVTAEQLMGASQHQAQVIAGASEATNEMANTIEQVSTNAAESAAVADRSVSIAKVGTGVVKDTIKGMETIREQIQDTSKRIKQLGESSQEIGDIVSLINDIAEQTNILALNAAIQASMAGDAGRGFAVVADEVQRLAERSAGATKQIASLVKTIQTDTNEAVSSMEQTTSEVVKGAELAQNAGVALDEIETVSADLATMIRDISTSASSQATTAGHISNTMNVIQDITSQTLSGTQTTAGSIGELADLAVDLKASVSGFRLPGESEVMHASTPANEPEAAGDGIYLDEEWSRDLGSEEAEVLDSAPEEPNNEDDANSGSQSLNPNYFDSIGAREHSHDEPIAKGVTPAEKLAAELESEDVHWRGVQSGSNIDSLLKDDNFTIDLDELDLQGIEAELGLTEEDIEVAKNR